jgi:hypothetical protein
MSSEGISVSHTSLEDNKSEENNEIIYKIYSVKNYAYANEDFIKKNEIVFNKKIKLCNELEKDNSYHFRIHKNTQYIFFGDLDGYIKGFNC